MGGFTWDTNKYKFHVRQHKPTTPLSDLFHHLAIHIPNHVKDGKYQNHANTYTHTQEVQINLTSLNPQGKLVGTQTNAQVSKGNSN